MPSPPPFDKFDELLDQADEYLRSVEELVIGYAPELPPIHEAVNRLWVDIARYGPGLPAFPEVRIPHLGDFQVPPPPPPPPPAAMPFFDAPGQWVKNHPKTTTAVVLGVFGSGLYVAYARSLKVQDRRRHLGQKLKAQTQGPEPKQVVIVLGGDTPHGLPLILELEKKGYIVVTSVSSAENVDALEAKCNGFVKALVLNPLEPATVPIFLRSLSSTLSRKFPLGSAGDPYQSPSSQPYVHSVISLLTLPSSTSTTLGPMEHISLTKDYIPYLTATQITPLQVIQKLLPVLRTGAARSRDKGDKTIIVCLPAVDTQVSLPFSSVQAMSAAGTLKAVEVLRREIRVAAATGKAESMNSIKVVIVDVGSVETTVPPPEGQEDPLRSTERWTANERLIYGPAFVSTLQQEQQPTYWNSMTSLFDEDRRYTVMRRPAKVSSLVEKIVSVVNGGRGGPTVFGHNIGLGYVQTWLRGDRFAVGAGALTYRMASYLPSLLLDGLLNLPYYLVGLRNRLLPTQPFRRPPRDVPRNARRSPASSRTPHTETQTRRNGPILAIEASQEDLLAVLESTSQAETAGKVEIDDAALASKEVEEEVEVGNEPETVHDSWISLQSGYSSEGPALNDASFVS